MSAAAYTGIPLAMLATTSFNLGLIQEKRALGAMPAIDLRRVGYVVAGLLASPAWLAGFALMLTGLACQTVVLTFEPVSIVQPVLSCGVVLVLVLSRLVLRERLRGGESWCVAAIAVSVVMLALSASGDGGSSAGRGVNPVLMAAVAVPSVLLGLLVSASALRARAGRHRLPATGVCFGVGTGLLYGVASLAVKGLSTVLDRGHAVTGIVTSPYLYVLFGCSGVAMLLYQAALQSCRASILIPVSTVTSSGYFLVAGTWLFHEHLPGSPVRLALRLTGVVVTCLVVVLLARRSPSAGEQVHDQPRRPDEHDRTRQPVPRRSGVVYHEAHAGGQQG
jgi:drug/metabolite transporter (DMT)-like permease